VRADFIVKICFRVTEGGTVIAGRVSAGRIEEGEVGMTPRGKRFTVVKIMNHDQQVRSAGKGQKVVLHLKNVPVSELRPGVTLYFN